MAENKVAAEYTDHPVSIIFLTEGYICILMYTKEKLK